jgi:hypothetical protein
LLQTCLKDDSIMQDDLRLLVEKHPAIVFFGKAING